MTFPTAEEQEEFLARLHGSAGRAETEVLIRSWNEDLVLYTARVPQGAEAGERLRLALEAAVQDGVDLAHADLDKARLVGAKLAGARLAGALLRDADLLGADLRGADLRFASLAGANLFGADFKDADLTEADLHHALSEGALFANTRFREGVVLDRPPIRVNGLFHPILIVPGHMAVADEFFSLQEWERFDDARILALDGPDFLAFWKIYKPALLALGRAHDTAPPMK